MSNLSKFKHVIFEGGDMAGKTTVIESLTSKYPDIEFQDRNPYICGYMFDTIMPKDRYDIISLHIDCELEDSLVIFLVNTNEKELNERFEIRKQLAKQNNEKVCKYDKEALKYNQMYLELGESLLYNNYDNFVLIVANNKSKQDLLDEVIQIIENKCY